jgi:hypothetical protein
LGKNPKEVKTYCDSAQIQLRYFVTPKLPEIPIKKKTAMKIRYDIIVNIGEEYPKSNFRSMEEHLWSRNSTRYYALYSASQ